MSGLVYKVLSNDLTDADVLNFSGVIQGAPVELQMKIWLADANHRQIGKTYMATLGVGPFGLAKFGKDDVFGSLKNLKIGDVHIEFELTAKTMGTYVLNSVDFQFEAGDMMKMNRPAAVPDHSATLLLTFSGFFYPRSDVSWPVEPSTMETTLPYP
jgi:hypothetical protein